MLWPVLVPIVYAALLSQVRQKVRKASTNSPLARATRFLWKDYRSDFLVWDLVDTLRKLLLTSFVLFVDTETGSRKLLRLFLALLLLSAYLAVLCLARPFKMSSDLYLACMS